MDKFNVFSDGPIVAPGMVSSRFLSLGIDTFLYTEALIPNVSAIEEYLKYRDALNVNVLNRYEF
jgi:hypothetical protein